jgi:alpha-1,6-mannosyltransferase
VARSTLPAPPRQPRAADPLTAPVRGRGRARSAEFAGSLALAVLVAAMAMLAITAAADPSGAVPKATPRFFPLWLSGPLRGIGPRPTITLLEVLVIAVAACYLVILRCAPALSPRRLWGAIVLAHVVAVLAPPLFSADVLGYLGFARLHVLHGLSPYAFAVDAAPHDPINALVGWRTLTTPYGPLFTLASDALVPLGIAAGVWVLKVLAGLASLATVLVIWRLAPRLQRSREGAIAFYGLNPVVLIFAVPAAHNETLIGLLVALGALGVVAGAEERGAIALVAAGAIKASSALVLPFALLGSRRHMRAALAIALGAAVTVLGGVAVFGPHVFSIAGAVVTQQGKIAGHSVPSQVSQLLGLGRLAPGVRAAFAVMLAAALAAALWRTWRGGWWLDGYGWSTLALLAATAWLLPWYGLWALLPASLSTSRRLRAAAVAATVYLIVMQIAIKRPLSAG